MRAFLFLFLFGTLSMVGLFLAVFWTRITLIRGAAIRFKWPWHQDRYFILSAGVALSFFRPRDCLRQPFCSPIFFTACRRFYNMARRGQSALASRCCRSATCFWCGWPTLKWNRHAGVG